MSALSVDEIIEKVLINDRATYSREVKSKSVRESEQFQNYKLQEENQELRLKLKTLKDRVRGMLKKREQRIKAEDEIGSIQKRIKSIVKKNIGIQRSINSLRVQNEKINLSISKELSLSKFRGQRDCLCSRKSPEKGKIVKTKQSVAIGTDNLAFEMKPEKEIAIQCEFPQQSPTFILTKQKNIESLQRIIKQQQSIIRSYKQTITRTSKNNTKQLVATSFRRQQCFNPSNTRSIHSVGSIVKMRNPI